MPIETPSGKTSPWFVSSNYNEIVVSCTRTVHWERIGFTLLGLFILWALGQCLGPDPPTRTSAVRSTPTQQSAPTRQTTTSRTTTSSGQIASRNWIGSSVKLRLSPGETAPWTRLLPPGEIARFVYFTYRAPAGRTARPAYQFVACERAPASEPQYLPIQYDERMTLPVNPKKATPRVCGTRSGIWSVTPLTTFGDWYMHHFALRTSKKPAYTTRMWYAGNGNWEQEPSKEEVRQRGGGQCISLYYDGGQATTATVTLSTFE